MEEDGFDRKVLDEIHTPVGLDIHAETPEEIAVSIVSELIKEKNSVRKTSGYDAELLDYLDGKIPAVDELEETLLDPFGRGTDYKEEAVNFNLWKQNASANVI